MPEIVFLFGAGASYGAGDVYPSPPPLMRGLYDELALMFPSQWGRLSQHRRHFQEDFEAAFAKTVLGLPPDPGMPPFRANTLTIADDYLWPLAMFFAQYTLKGRGQDCYSKLLQTLIDGGMLGNVTFSSLNYDCLFEQAVEGLGRSLHYGPLSSDAAGDQVTILKPHGSCTFVCSSSYDPQHTRALLSSVTVLEMQPRIVPMTGLSGRLTALLDRGDYPYMSQISAGKESVTGGMRLQLIRQAWNASVERAESLVVIGVAGALNDRHVVDAVRRAKRLIYVGRARDFERWEAVSPGAEHVGEYFDESLDGLARMIGSK